MKEYKLIIKETSEMQKLLNQWRQKYHLEIISVKTFPSRDGIVDWGILLTREEKTYESEI